VRNLSSESTLHPETASWCLQFRARVRALSFLEKPCGWSQEEREEFFDIDGYSTPVLGEDGVPRKMPQDDPDGASSFHTDRLERIRTKNRDRRVQLGKSIVRKFRKFWRRNMKVKLGSIESRRSKRTTLSLSKLSLIRHVD